MYQNPLVVTMKFKYKTGKIYIKKGDEETAIHQITIEIKLLQVPLQPSIMY